LCLGFLLLLLCGIGGAYFFLEFVGAVGDADGEDAGEDPWRGAHEESGHVAESEGFGQSRLPVCVSMSTPKDGRSLTYEVCVER
jgi:hypothetical protein